MRPRFLVGLFLLIIAYSGQAIACSCVSPTLVEEVKDTPAIFTGKVTKLEVVRVHEGVSIIEVTVERDRTFKGAVPGIVIFTTSDGCCYCAPWFEIAKTYIFFARESDGQFQTDGCSRTKLLAAADDEVAYLEKGVLNPAAPD